MICMKKNVGRKEIILSIIAFAVIAMGFAIPARSQAIESNPDTLKDTETIRVVSLKNIDYNKLQQYFKMAGFTDNIEAMSPKMVQIKGSRNRIKDLAEFTKLVDDPKAFFVKRIKMPNNQMLDLPKLLEANSRSHVETGSFKDPPSGLGQKAIVDIISGDIFIAAPADKFDDIQKNIMTAIIAKAAIDHAPNSAENMIQTTVAEPNLSAAVQPDTAEPNSLDDVFSQLMASLNEPNAPVNINSVQTTIPKNNAIDENAQPATLSMQREQFLEKLKQIQNTQDEITAEIEKAKTQNQSFQTSGIVDIEQKQKTKAAQRSYDTESIPNGEDVLDITIPEKQTLEEFIRLVGKFMKIDFFYDPKIIKGEVEFKFDGELRGGQIKVKELYPMLESILHYNDLAMVKKDNFVIIVPRDQVSKIDPKFISDDQGDIQVGDAVITRLFTLDHIDAEDAKNLLAGMGLGVDINTSASSAGIMMVTGYRYRMSRIEQLVRMIDVQGKQKQFRFRQLQHTVAAEAKDQIQTLAEQIGTVSITISQTAAPAPARPTASTARTAAQRAAAQRAAVRSTPTATSGTTGAREADTVYLDADERTNRILMIGIADKLDIVEKIIDTLDVEKKQMRETKLYDIEHADAKEIIEKLQQLGIIGNVTSSTRTNTTSNIRTSNARTAANNRITTPGTTPGAQPETIFGEELDVLSGQPQVVIIEATNSLLVNATEEQHVQIATIIGYIDVEPEETSINYVVYPLEAQEPEDLAAILNQLISDTQQQQQKDAAGKITQTSTMTKKSDEDITIIPDEKTFSLIVNASKSNQQWISSLIKQLDRRRPQVLIDVTLVEITKDDAFSLDLSAITKFPGVASTSLFPAEGFGNLASATHGRIYGSSMSASGSNAFYGDKHVQFLFEAMQKKGYGRILANPKLLVNDNEPATIETQEEKNVVSATVTPGLTTGTSIQSATISVSTQTYTAGIKLDIEPHISEGDLLRLKIDVTRSDFKNLGEEYSLNTSEGEITGPMPPDKVTSTVNTVITVPDKKTIILGGLEKLNQSKGGTKTPFLGDIPIIGGLFRQTSNSDSQSRLYLFVKAYIIRPEDAESGQSDIVDISKKNRAEFEKYEQQMQEYEDWPGIKPTPLEPIRVLEDD